LREYSQDSKNCIAKGKERGEQEGKWERYCRRAMGTGWSNGGRSSSLFLFRGRRTDRIKALYYSGDGYVLLYKRLNNGTFQWTRTGAELRKLDGRSIRWLMEGLSVEQPKAIRKGRAKDLF